MLAKLEYFSPPDEVCCWQGRRSGAAGRGAVAELLAGSNAAECHREDVAGLGAAAELLTGRYAVAKRRAGAPQWRRGRQGTPQWQRGCLQGRDDRVGGAGEEYQWQGNTSGKGIPVARERHSRLARERRGRLAGNAAADWHGNTRNAKEPAPTDGTGPSQTFGCIQAEQSLVEDFACLFLLGMRIYI